MGFTILTIPTRTEWAAHRRDEIFQRVERDRWEEIRYPDDWDKDAV